MINMNEFTVKKLAEVQAFIDLASPILDRSNGDFEKKAQAVSAALQKLRQSNNIKCYVVEADYGDLFESKRQRTGAKLTQMMELYIGSSWDDPVEVLEWLSFYAGAASAHAGLAAAALQELDIQDGFVATQQLSTDFAGLLDAVKQELVTLALRSM